MRFDDASGRFAPSDRAIPVTGALFVSVADRNNLNAFIAEEIAEVVRARVADADHGEIDAAVRAAPSFSAENRRRNDIWKCDQRHRRGRTARKFTAREDRFVHNFVGDDFGYNIGLDSETK